MPIEMSILVPGSSFSFRGGFFGFSVIVLLRHPDLGPVLFDTGHHSTRHLLLAALENEGIAPANIRHVFLSHLHFDHINNAELFPKATFYVAQSEWDYSARPHPRDLFGSVAVRDWLGGRRLNFLGDAGELAPGLSYRHAPGHTPGMTILHYLDASGTRVVVAGDACKTYRELVTGQAGEAYDPLDRTAGTLDWIRENSDVIICGHHPVLYRSAAGWVWNDVSSIELIAR